MSKLKSGKGAMEGAAEASALREACNGGSSGLLCLQQRDRQGEEGKQTKRSGELLKYQR